MGGQNIGVLPASISHCQFENEAVTFNESACHLNYGRDLKLAKAGSITTKNRVEVNV
jgi:hypothetical protein